LDLYCTVCLFFFILTRSIDNSIGNEGATKLFEALISNSSLTSLNLGGNECDFISFSLNTVNHQEEGGIKLSKLSEALKSNTSLTSLNLYCNKIVIVTSFNSH